MKDLQINNKSYQKIKRFIKEYFEIHTKNYLNNLNNLDLINGIKIKFVDLLDNSDYIYPNDENLSSKSGIYGSIDVYPDLDKDFNIIYATGNYSRILFGEPDKYWVDYFKRKIRIIVKHECYHLKQFLYIIENTSDWEESLILITKYNSIIPHNLREYEIEANKASISNPNLKSFDKYLSCFIV